MELLVVMDGFASQVMVAKGKGRCRTWCHGGLG